MTGGMDVNGDGLADFVIAPARNGTNGYFAIVFGQTSGSVIQEPSNLASWTQGFRFYPDNSTQYSKAALVGDVNGDGLADILIGTPLSYDSSSSYSWDGRAYVVFGKSATSTVYASDLANGSGGFQIRSNVLTNNQFGYTISALGDINCDGLSDLLIGSISNNSIFNNASSQLTKSYIVFGKTGTGSASDTVTTSELEANIGGYVVNGAYANNQAGRVAGLGDVNGDGMNDFIVGAPHETLTGQPSLGGGAYVVFGDSGRNSAVNLASVLSGSGGFAIKGNVTGNYSYAGVSKSIAKTYLLGDRVFSAGDVNGDGLADIYLPVDTAHGFVVFGKSTTSSISTTDLEFGLGGFNIIYDSAVQNYTVSTWSIAQAGDINGDGLSDLILGQRSTDTTIGTDAGRSWVVFGKSGSSTIYLSDVGNGSGGFCIDAEAANNGSGNSVSAAGDVNGDGLADLLVASPFYGSGGGNGRSYVLFGSTSGTVSTSSFVDQFGGTTDDIITGTSPGQTLVGGRGNDVITGAGGADILYGGLGDDVFNINDTMLTALSNSFSTGGNSKQLARIDGGYGYDTIALAGSGLAFDLTKVANQGFGMSMLSRLNSIECINLAGSGANGLKLGLLDINDLTLMNQINSSTAVALGFSSGNYTFASKESRHQLVVAGDSDDGLTVANGSWSKVGYVVKANQNYDVWNSSTGLCQLLVSQAILTTGL